MANTLIIDNGAYSLKTGWSEDFSSNVKVIPNCVSKVKSERRRPFIGDQLDDCKDYSGLFYILPAQKGYIVNWDIQKQVWNYVLKNKYSETLGCLDEKNLLLTEAYFNFRSIQENLLEIYYEEYGFDRISLMTPASLVGFKDHLINPNNLSSLIVDSGYSYTHIIPIVKGKIRKDGIRRIDVGGKALTNHLKDIISYRQLHVLDETFVMNQCKEDTCFVSQNLDKDLEICKSNRSNNTIVCDYVLPDYTLTRRGFIRDPKNPARVPANLVKAATPMNGSSNSGISNSGISNTGVQKTVNPKGDIIVDKDQLLAQQTIRMNNERFQVPELLFYPSDAGMNQIGISHSIIHSVENVEAEIRPHLYRNIILIGGNGILPGFKERIQSDIRSMADALYDVNVTLPDDPVTEPWNAGHLLANTKDQYESRSVSRSEYQEHGPASVIQRFMD